MIFHEKRFTGRYRITPMIFAVCGLLIAQVAPADVVVVNTLGTDDAYHGVGVYTVGNTNINFPSPLEEAAPFTAQASGLLSSIQLALISSGGPIPTTDADVFLYGNTNGLPDNSNQIFLGSVSPSGDFGLPVNSSVVSLTVNGPVSVTLGSTYWLVLKPAAPTGFAGWVYTAASPLGEMRYSSDNLTWNLQFPPQSAGFRIFAVPEPGVPVLMCLGLAALYFVRREPGRYA